MALGYHIIKGRKYFNSRCQRLLLRGAAAAFASSDHTQATVVQWDTNGCPARSLTDRFLTSVAQKQREAIAAALQRAPLHEQSAAVDLTYDVILPCVQKAITSVHKYRVTQEGQRFLLQ